MNETERSGFEPAVALKTQAHRLEFGEPRQQHGAADFADGQAILKAPPAPAHSRSNLGQIKSRLRPLAARGYRLLKPFLRPLVFRIRGYFLAAVRAEMQQAASLHEARRHDDRAALDDARRTLSAVRQELMETMESLAFQNLQEMQSMRNVILRAQAATERAPRFERIEQYSLASARRVAIAGEPGEVLVRSAVGYILCPASDYALLAILLDAGELEPGTRLLMQSLLRPGDHFVDVGANIGMLSLTAARVIGPTGRLWAFEPHPVTHDLLRRSLLLNGAHCAHSFQAAVSDEVGHLPLHIGATSGHHSLFPLDPNEGTLGETIDVPLVRIDDVVEPGMRVDLMKIDVEGAELQVLRGALRVLADNPQCALVVEFGISHLQRTGQATAEWLAAFEHEGFVYQAVDEASGAIRPTTAVEIESVDSVNLLFARPGSQAWQRAGDDA